MEYPHRCSACANTIQVQNDLINTQLTLIEKMKFLLEARDLIIKQTLPRALSVISR